MPAPRSGYGGGYGGLREEEGRGPVMDDPEFDPEGSNYPRTRRPGGAKRAGPAWGDTFNTPEPADEFYETSVSAPLTQPTDSADATGQDIEAAEPNFWARTFLLGLFFGVLSVGYVGAALTFHVFLAMGLTLAAPVILEEIAARACGRCYRGARRDSDTDGKRGWRWPKTLQRVVLCFTLILGAGTCAAGYFGRDWYYAEHGPQYDRLVVDDGPKADAASIGVFTDASGTAVAKPQGAVGGRTLSFGVWPVCVGPILSDPTQKSVSYWALGHGKCCTSHPIECKGWSDTQQRGGIRAHFPDLYPGYKKAVTAASKEYGLVSHPDAVYVHYGDSDKMKNDLHYTATIVFASSCVLAVVFGLYRSCKGPY